ncbi:MAG TPA: pyridoxal-phosphate dependent enzyme [Acidimicrobiales bacterium]|nr:pyridoxal-phosphate dependent enzyme [Acidimicrobiales bacterium]
MRTVHLPTVDDVVAARDVIDRHLTPTPIISSAGLGSVVLKVETLQPTGSFKVRGALVAVAREHARPIVTASAGNHGLGVAYAATEYGASATIVIPTNASSVKRAALESFAVELVAAGESYDEAESHALELAARGAHFISPYNDPDTIAGQGTIALELFDQMPEVRQIVVPIGGGGLISGIGLASTLRRDVRVIGVQAAASPAMAAALDGVSSIDVQPTLADGLAGNLEDGTITIELTRRHVAEIVDVSEDEIASAVAFLSTRHGLVAEGSAAVGIAALLHGKIDADQPTAVIVTGRNIAPSTYIDILMREAGGPPPH